MAHNVSWQRTADINIFFGSKGANHIILITSEQC